MDVYVPSSAFDGTPTSVVVEKQDIGQVADFDHASPYSAPIHVDRSAQSIGNPYFRQIGEDILDSSNIEHGTSVSMSDDGRVIAISGMIVEGDKYLYSVSVNKDVDGNWVRVGATILEPFSTGTEYSSDASAEVSLSGDGSKLAIANVKANRGSGPSTGIVKIYSHSLDNTQTDWTSEGDAYSDDAGGVGTKGGLKISLNSDGSRLAVGVQYHDNIFTGRQDSGAVIIYSITSITTAILTQIHGTTSGDCAGSSVMISGDGKCVVFGSVGDANAIGINSGSASVYCHGVNDISSWSLRATVFGEGAYDKFGFSVALNTDASCIAVGSIYNDPDSTLVDAGHVRVFKYDINTNAYIQLGADIDGARGEKATGGQYYVGDLSGFSMSLSDVNDELGGVLRVAIGSPNNDGPGDEGDYYNGHVRLFQCNPTDSNPSWTQVLDDINGETARETSGYSISMSKDGRRIVVGSPNYFLQNGNFNGVAKVYEQTEHSDTPSDAPSASTVPSVVPSNALSVSSNPSAVLSNKPSLSPSTFPSSVSGNPSAVPTEVPSYSSLPTNIPTVGIAVANVFLIVLSGICLEADNDVISIIRQSLPASVANGANIELVEFTSSCTNNPVEGNEIRALSTGDSTEITAVVSAKLESNAIQASLEADLESNLPPASTVESIEILVSDEPSFSPSIVPSTNPSVSTIPSTSPSLSASPSLSPSFEPSVFPTTSNAPSQNPSNPLNKEFEIRSTFAKFDNSRKWCLTANDNVIGSKIHVRRCRTYSEKKDNLQLWKRDELDQLRLAGPATGFCVKSVSRTLALDLCHSLTKYPEFTFNVTDTQIIQEKNGKTFLIGFDTARKFSRQKLFKSGSINESLDKWKIRYEYETSLSPSSSR